MPVSSGRGGEIRLRALHEKGGAPETPPLMTGQNGTRPVPESASLDGVAQRVLGAADGIAHLALGLVRLALGFQLGIAGHLAGGFLGGALDLLRRALHAFLVDHVVVLRPRNESTGQRRVGTNVPAPAAQSSWRSKSMSS